MYCSGRSCLALLYGTTEVYNFDFCSCAKGARWGDEGRKENAAVLYCTILYIAMQEPRREGGQEATGDGRRATG